MMKDYATGIQHIGIPTKDIKVTKEFYKKIGFETAFETVNEGAKVAFLKLGSLIVETYESEDAAMKNGAVDHIAIDVKDVKRTYEEICEMSMNNMNDEIHFLPFWDNGVRYFKIEGPNKEIIEFSQFL